MSNEIIFLSILVPVYNAEKYLTECLDSILKQDVDFAQYEIICVDDGSKDSSLEILRKYEQQFSSVKVISKNNGGVASARNTAMKHAKGKYVMFVDSDDGIAAGSLIQIIQQLKNFEPAMLRYSFRCVHSDSIDNKSIEKIEFKKKAVNPDDAPFQVWGMVFKRLIAESANIEFDSRFRTREDYIFNYLLMAFALGQDVITTDAEIYEYRIRNDSLSHMMDYKSETFQRERLTNMLDYVRLCQEFLIEHDECMPAIKNKIKWKTEYFAASALMCALRCKSVNVKEIQNELKKIGVYPYKNGFRNSRISEKIKLLITSRPFINIIDKTGLMNAN